MSFDYRNKYLETIGENEKNNGVYSKTIFGQDIQENPVPVWTSDKLSNPYVIFKDSKSKKSIGISRDKLALGMLALGVPGSGKTNFFNINLNRILETMENDDVIVIFDTKGDYLSEFGNKIPESEKIVIGNGEEYRNITNYHNIFAEIMPRGADGKLVYSYDSDVDALDISKQLFSNMKSESQPIFPAMSEQIFAAVLIYYMRTFWKTDQSKLNNRDLIHFFSSGTNEDLKKIFNLDYMRDQRSCMDYIAGKNNQTQGVNSYIGSILRTMFIGPFKEGNHDREFSMRDVMYGNQKKVVFIEYDLQKGYALAPMYGLIIDRALAYALGGRGENKKNKYFLLDEMLLLPKLMHIQDSVNFGRSQGVKVMCGLQNIMGLEDLYGEDGAKNILASFQNMVVFRVNDFDTRQFVIQRLGKNYSNHSLSAQQENMNVQREGNTIEDWQLLSLKLGEAVVLLEGESPFFFTMPLYK